MNIDRAVQMLAGTMVLISVALAWLVSPYWLVLTALVGVNMFQAALSGFCPAATATVFRELGLKEGPAFTCSPAKASRSVAV
jgi:hypothetical protein